VFSKSNEDVELYRIKDWAMHEPLIQRMFGKGKVSVFSSDRSAPELHLNWISQPSEFVERLRGAVEAVRDSKRVRELDMGMTDGTEVDIQ
ncbi:MAG: PH domain-containing protein, partial [Verrucomicrobiales bacterium]